jgi:hypothetical protein
VIGLAGRADAQQPMDRSLVEASSCVSGTDYEREGYGIRSATVIAPFDYVRRVGRAVSAAAAQADVLAGTPFEYAKVSETREAIAALEWLPDTVDQRIRVDLVITSVANCSNRQLDLEYRVFSTQVLGLPGLAWEAHQTEQREPHDSAGVTGGSGVLRLIPSISYDATNGVGGGVGAHYSLPNGATGPIESLSGSFERSEHGNREALEVGGSRQHSSSPFAQTWWDASYEGQVSPALGTTITRRRASGLMWTSTRPVVNVMPIRLGAMYSLGRHESSDAVPLDGLQDADYQSLKLMAGITGQKGFNAFAVSYGYELGAVPAGARWHKHVIDVAHDASFPGGSHRQFDVESRLTAGTLSSDGELPVGTRFTGGNREERFMPASDWQIRANPVIRSIPADQFTLPGRGSTGFVSYNVTASYPLFHIPLVPGALTEDPELQGLLDTQLETATNALQVDYEARDKHFKAAAEQLPGIVRELKALQALLGKHSPVPGSALALSLAACAKTTSAALRRAEAASGQEGVQQYGNVVLLLPASPANVNGEDLLGAVVVACLVNLNIGLWDTGIDAAGALLAESRRWAADEFERIDRAAAADAAGREVGPARRTLDRLLREVNLFSVGPVFIFDVARISDRGRSRTDVGIGGGVRFILASTVQFTAAYAVNRPGQFGDGAFTFSMRIRDLLN